MFWPEKKGKRHARIQKVFKGGPTLTRFYLVDERRENPNATMSGPSSALNGVSLAGRWWPNIECWLCSFVV